MMVYTHIGEQLGINKLSKKVSFDFDAYTSRCPAAFSYDSLVNNLAPLVEWCTDNTTKQDLERTKNFDRAFKKLSSGRSKFSDLRSRFTGSDLLKTCTSRDEVDEWVHDLTRVAARTTLAYETNTSSGPPTLAI